MPKNRLISGTSKLYHNLRPWVKRNISVMPVAHERAGGIDAFNNNAGRLRLIDKRA